ncbi:radical SAM protein [Trueperella pyogenes]|uniref:radical SAM protein n=1 Tax=Trueperella pyogenes TaxID=1661 RepID=UPI003873AC24
MTSRRSARVTELELAPVEDFSAYVHVPFCSVRCGYCDFNTYTNLDFGDGASADRFADTLIREVELVADTVTATRPLRTVFFGGGTPTMLASRDLAAILAALTDAFGSPTGGSPQRPTRKRSRHACSRISPRPALRGFLSACNLPASTC